MVKSLGELAANPENPRKISGAKLELLRKALHKFGDLSGFIFNRKTKHLISGHQRLKVFGPEAEVSIEHTFKKATRTGTVAEGSVLLDGERYKYREVLWDRTKEKAAAIAANRNAGDWDDELLGDWLSELRDFEFDLDLTMFDLKERIKLFGDESTTTVREHERKGAKELNEEDFSEFDHKCPRCNFEFNSDN